MKQQFATILFCAAIITPIFSKAQLHMAISVGSGVSYVQQKNTNKTYSPIARPDGNVSLIVPIRKNIALEAGVGYHMKGYSVIHSYDFTGGKTDFTTKNRMHYLSVPLMFSYRLFEHNKWQFWISGGMNYDIFLAGNLSYEFANYIGNNLDSRQVISYKIKGRLASTKFGATENTYDVEALDVSLKLQLRLISNGRYTISAYHIHSLYDNRANPDDAVPSSLKFRYTGISFGVML